MAYDDKEEDVKQKRGAKKVYLIIDGEKHYLDPEIVKKYHLDKEEFSFFSGNRLYIEKS
jgi:hypothetical protein